MTNPSSPIGAWDFVSNRVSELLLSPRITRSQLYAIVIFLRKLQQCESLSFEVATLTPGRVRGRRRSTQWLLTGSVTVRRRSRHLSGKISSCSQGTRYAHHAAKRERCPTCNGFGLSDRKPFLLSANLGRRALKIFAYEVWCTA